MCYVFNVKICSLVKQFLLQTCLHILFWFMKSDKCYISLELRWSYHHIVAFEKENLFKALYKAPLTRKASVDQRSVLKIQKDMLIWSLKLHNCGYARVTTTAKLRVERGRRENLLKMVRLQMRSPTGDVFYLFS